MKHFGAYPEDQAKTRKAEIPQGLNASWIGHTVTFQAFPYESSTSDTLVTDKMEKYVGVLEYYFLKEGTFVFKLQGMNGGITSYAHREYLEFHPHMKGNSDD